MPNQFPVHLSVSSISQFCLLPLEKYKVFNYLTKALICPPNNRSCEVSPVYGDVKSVH